MRNKLYDSQVDFIGSHLSCSNTVCIGKYIAKITSMSFLVSWSSVSFTMGIVVGTSAHAAVGEVGKLVNVKAVLSGLEARY
jgi:hypothetical protein